MKYTCKEKNNVLFMSCYQTLLTNLVKYKNMVFYGYPPFAVYYILPLKYSIF